MFKLESRNQNVDGQTDVRHINLHKNSTAVGEAIFFCERCVASTRLVGSDTLACYLCSHMTGISPVLMKQWDICIYVRHG